MKGMKIWINTLVEYDAYGNATILKSFMSPAKDSPVKYGAKKKLVKKPPVQSGETKLWD